MAIPRELYDKQMMYEQERMKHEYMNQMMGTNPFDPYGQMSGLQQSAQKTAEPAPNKVLLLLEE